MVVFALPPVTAAGSWLTDAAGGSVLPPPEQAQRLRIMANTNNSANAFFIFESSIC